LTAKGKDIRYVAELKHVREVSLIGTSDFGFWHDCLEAEELVPVRCANRDRGGRVGISPQFRFDDPIDGDKPVRCIGKGPLILAANATSDRDGP